MLARLLLGMGATAIYGAASTDSSHAWIIQWMPVFIAVVVLILTRLIMDMNAPKKRTWTYNTTVMCLCAVVTAVFTHEWSLTAGQATLLGMGAGAAGASIISFGKPALVAMMSKGLEGLKGK